MPILRTVFLTWLLGSATITGIFSLEIMKKRTSRGEADISYRWMIPVRFLSVLPILLLLCCSPARESPVFRLIDHLDRENILRSPFLIDASTSGEGEKGALPPLPTVNGASLLLDAGVRENPYLLKQKLKIGLVEINALLAPPESRYRFRKKINGPAFLEFTYGIKRDEEMAREQSGVRVVDFSITLAAEGSDTEIFRNTLRLSPRDPLVFNYKRIDLSAYAGNEVRIDFSTRGSRRALACWFNPVLYTPRRDTRNVVLISLDTLRPDHLGCYGYSRDTSPNIDALAQDSVLFLNTFATSPWTLPSHVSLMTSLNCINHQVYQSDQTMDPSLKPLADFLRESGFTTGAVTGGGFVSGLYGFSRGFDSYHVRGQIQAADAAETACRAAVDWIERHRDRDFFLFLHTYQIHNPYRSPPPYNRLFAEKESALTWVDMSPLRLNHENRYQPVSPELRQNFIDLYDGEIRYTDEALVGPILKKLRESDLYDDTMIILTSDHGEEFYEHQSWLHTHSLYNETIRVPLIVKFFGKENRGRQIDRFARLVDIMPTILDALDISPGKRRLDGQSLLPLLEDARRENEERTFIAELAPDVMGKHVPRKAAANRGRLKLILHDPYSPQDLAYFRFPPPQVHPVEIFDLDEDAGEQKNLALQDPELARVLLDFFRERNVQKSEAKAEKARMDEKLREQLKALGYIK